MEEKMQEQQEWDDAMKSLMEYDKEVCDHNNKLYRSVGATNREMSGLLFHCNVSGKMSIVDKPSGEDQSEDCGIFTQVFVNQQSVGTEGDSFEGDIYAKFDDNKWLKIPFEC